MIWKKLKKAIPDSWLKRVKEDSVPEGDWKISVYQEDIEAFHRKNGPKATASVLSKLGKYQPYYNLLTSELGQILLGDSIAQCNYFLLKIAENKATEADKAEYRAYRRIIDRQIEHIYSYWRTAERLRG